MFWVLWFSMVLIFLFSVVGVFAWNGSLLELVKIKTAKNLWLLSTGAITLGLILFVFSVMTIIGNPDLITQFSAQSQSPPQLMWIAIFLLLIGGSVVGIPTQLYQLKFTKLSRNARKNLFYLGIILLTLSVLLLIWLLMPGNQLPV